MTKKLRGLAAAPGVASGRAHVIIHGKAGAAQRQIEDVQDELQRLEAAVAVAEIELQALAERSTQQVGKEEAAIFRAHCTMLHDPELQSRVRKSVQRQQVNVEFAWQESIHFYADALRNVGDEYLAARAADVEDVGQRVLGILTGTSAQADKLDEPAIIVADDLTPADTVLFDRSLVLGFCTCGGGPTSHVAILSKALGVPCVVGLSAELAEVGDGAFLIVDGGAGVVWIEPEAETRAHYGAIAAEQLEQRQQALRESAMPAVTLDGHRVEVVANVGSLADAAEAVKDGAEGIGLLRTEFLFLDRPSEPDEKEQVETYTGIFATIGTSKPIVVRTLDIGGDKPARYLELPKESNPFLGVRGLRLGLRFPSLLESQLRALLIAGRGYDLRIMFPMVSSVEELERARQILEKCKAALKAEGLPSIENPQVGIMVEVPSAAIMAKAFAPMVDFFSIGTNDLSQYTLAAERTSPDVAYLADPLHPAVIELIRGVIEAGHAHGKWVGVCGEMAGDPLATPILLGLGLDEFSASPRLIPQLKQTIGRFSVGEACDVAAKALWLRNAAEVHEYLRGVATEAGGVRQPGIRT